VLLPICLPFGKGCICEGLQNFLSHGFVRFQSVLPNANNYPSLFPKYQIGLLISRHVALNFTEPIRPVVLGHAQVLWTSMPETPVHEDSNALLFENEIRFAVQILIPSPSFDSVFPKDLDESDLSGFIAFASNGRHAL
jgi:hypothetical protein